MAVSYDKIIENVQKAAENFINLKITTVVGTFDVTGSGTDIGVQARAGEQKVMFTQLNIVEGDISNYIDTEFAQNDDHPMRRFHTDQVLKAQSTVKGTVDSVQKMVETLITLVKESGTPQQ
jgi:hypothetical protein